MIYVEEKFSVELWMIHDLICVKWIPYDLCWVKSDLIQYLFTKNKRDMQISSKQHSHRTHIPNGFA